MVSKATTLIAAILAFPIHAAPASRHDILPRDGSDINFLYDPGPHYLCYEWSEEGTSSVTPNPNKRNDQCTNFLIPAREDWNCASFGADIPSNGAPTCPTWVLINYGWSYETSAGTSDYGVTPGYDANISGGNGSPVTVQLVNNARDTADCGLREVTFSYQYGPDSFVKLAPDGHQYTLDDADQFVVNYDIAITADASAESRTVSPSCDGQRRYMTTDFIYTYEVCGNSSDPACWPKNVLSIKHFDPSDNTTPWNPQSPEGCRLQIEGQQIAEGVSSSIELDFKALILQYSTQLCHSGYVPAKVQVLAVQIVSSNIASDTTVDIDNVTIVLRNSTSSSNSGGTQTSYGICSGTTNGVAYTGPTACPTGQFCSTQNPYYAQCTPTVAARAVVPREMITAAPRAPIVARQDVASLYSQCGGSTNGAAWTGATLCPAGACCSTQNEYYAQCTTGSVCTSSSPPIVSTTTPAVSVQSAGGTASLFSQCGGSTNGAAWAGPTLCPAGACCSTQNEYYAQCTTGSACTSSSPPISTTTTTSLPSSPTGSTVKLAGVNIAGCDFGANTDGTWSSSSVQCPPPGYADQINHFVNDDGLTAFRLPVAWPYLVDSPGATLDATHFAAYDKLVQACISVAKLCIIDIHSYARWTDSGIIGQSDITNDDFNSLWEQLATHYANVDKVAFGIMNEPWGVDTTEWTATVQGVVNTIRAATGTNSQYILLPSTDYDHIDGSSEYILQAVQNPSGDAYANLVFDIHEYLNTVDEDNSGQTAECDTPRVTDSTYINFTNWLRSNNRMAFLSETGGGESTDCINYMCEQMSYLNTNNDVWLGWTGWAAGAFNANQDPNSSPYFSETPSGSPGSYVDTQLVTKCIAGKYNGRNGV